MVPLLKLTVSPDPGTAAGVQLVLLNQSVLTEPFHVSDAPWTENRAVLMSSVQQSLMKVSYQCGKMWR